MVEVWKVLAHVSHNAIDLSLFSLDTKGLRVDQLQEKRVHLRENYLIKKTICKLSLSTVLVKDVVV